MAKVITAGEIGTFRRTVWNYFKKHKRDLPWRHNMSPYRVLVSEVMLQQTQANRVAERYRLFLKLFPDFKALARAKSSDVLKAWSGLGYYRRALNLKRTAEVVMEKHGGRLPSAMNELVELPGIGKNTAGAIVAYAFNKQVVYIETNIRRIYIHHFFHDQSNVHDADLLPIIERSLPKNRTREWYQALMDYGTYLAATVENPNRKSKHYARQSKFEGSRRQVRGKILKLLLDHPSLTLGQLVKMTEKPAELVKEIAGELMKEKFIIHQKGRFKIL